MAFTGNYICTSFKVDLLYGRHNFGASGGSTFKIALYTNSATMTASTTAYATTGEVATAGGYTAGGVTLTNVNPSNPSGVTAITDFSPDPTWATSTITARGALIYNTTASNAGVVVLDFGSDKASSAGDFTVVFPNPDATNAIIRIA